MCWKAGISHLNPAYYYYIRVSFAFVAVTEAEPPASKLTCPEDLVSRIQPYLGVTLVREFGCIYKFVVVDDNGAAIYHLDLKHGMYLLGLFGACWIDDLDKTHTQPFSGPLSGLPRWANTRRNIHPLTPILIVNHPYQLSPSTTIYSILLVPFTCLAVFFSTTFLQVLCGLCLSVWNRLLHTP